MNFLNKILNNSKIKMIIILSILLFMYFSICAMSYAQNISNNISDNVFRLHVIANSDTKEDQDLKLLVRDNLLKYMNNLCSNCSSKQEAMDLVVKNKNIFEKIAKETIYNNGYTYDININIGNYEFPTKNYGDISLPAGYYDALRVEIGGAKGQNWWCVMFPPLCFVDVSSGIVPEESKELMQNQLDTEEFALISSSPNPEIQFKFKLLEIFNKTGFITAKK